MFSLKSDNPSDFFYVKEPALRERWSKLCSNVKSCEKLVKLQEGKNNVAVKSDGVVVSEMDYQEIIVYVDSKKPIIKKIWHQRNSLLQEEEFGIDFEEKNLDEVLLQYGSNEAEMNSNEISADTNSDCESTGEDNQRCVFRVPGSMANYEGEKIKYRIIVADKAVNEASKTEFFEVDQTAPEIKFSDYVVRQRTVDFVLDIFEKNFQEVYYTDDNDAAGTKRRICSVLKYGRCFKTKTFGPGDYAFTIHVVDKAGNEAVESLDISTR